MTEDILIPETLAELESILLWWQNKMTDQQNGGFWGRIDGSGHRHEQAEKGVVLHTRILWAFSAAARSTGDTRWANIAHRAFDYLVSHFLDQVHGGVFWSLDAQGKPLQTKKQVYAQAFAIYASCEYYLLTQYPRSLDLSLNLFALLEKNAFDPVNNGYFEAYTREWALLDDLRLSEKDANEAKTQNTHLHVLEAYTNLVYAAPQQEQLKAQLENLITLFLDKFIAKAGHLQLFFDENWTLKSNTVSYGHDIEASWLIWNAANATQNQALIQRVQPYCLQLARAVLQNAVTPDGAVINEFYPDEQRRDEDRIWWVQAEAMTGFWCAYQISSDERFRQAAVQCWQYIKDKIRDPLGGEWWWRVSPAGEYDVKEDKAGFWKCPYHNSRALLYAFR
jgi:cellobiose epimerase